jgi:hypothetical protein
LARLCPTEAGLLIEYVAALDSHLKDVDEYSDMLRVGLDGDLFEVVRRRMQESREQTAEARKRYAAHREEHGCDLPIS